METDQKIQIPEGLTEEEFYDYFDLYRANLEVVKLLRKDINYQKLKAAHHQIKEFQALLDPQRRVLWAQMNQIRQKKIASLKTLYKKKREEAEKGGKDASTKQ